MSTRSQASTDPAVPADEQLNAQRHKLWPKLASLALAAALLYLALRGLDWAAFWIAIRNGRYELLLITVPIGAANYLIRSVRWRVFVQARGRAPLLSVLWANMVGYMGNAYLPARAGELLRSAFLARKTGLGTSFMLATALTERLFDVIALVLIGSLALLAQPGLLPALSGAVWVMALAGFVGLGIAVAAPSQEARCIGLVSRLPLSPSISGTIIQQTTRFMQGMRALQNWKRLLSFALLTVLIWLVDAIACVIGVHVVSQSLTLAQALILLAGLGLSSAIPSTPGYIGVYQFIAVTILLSFGFTKAAALGFILISQITNYLVVTILGLAGIWQLNRES